MRTPEWCAFADDWYYTVYNSKKTRARVERLAKSFEVLRLVVGDSDDSYAIYHYRDGILRRGVELNA